MQQTDFEKLLADTLAAHGRSPRTQETYTLMLRLFGRYLDETRSDKTLDTVAPEEIEAYQRYLVTKRKVGFSSFNQSTCALRFFYRTCLGKTDWTIARMPYQKKRRGTNIRVIQALLGHQCLTTTQVYTHVARTYVNATTRPLDRLKEKKEEPDKE